MKRKPNTKAPGGDRAEDRLELRLAEYSAPCGEEMPWRVAVSELPALADAGRDWKPEQGRLH